MDKDSICTLAELLRKDGDKLLQGEQKLLLSDIILKNLNDSFKFLVEEDDGDTTFIVTKTNNSNVEVIHDIQFLHDFIQKIVRVCITKDLTKPSAIRANLDISKFRSLQVLELRRISVWKICGIQHVRARLQCLVCIHCYLQMLQDVLIECGADMSSAYIWQELKVVILSYNAIEKIDNSFCYTPWLQTIDLSHNRIKDFRVLDCLPNLKRLDLSHNLMESSPVLGREASRKLEILQISHNYVKNLSDLSKLENLVKLDASCNSLTEHSVLSPLQRLPLLSWLNLVGNPLCFHSKHRIHTAHCLHLNAVTNRFMLDSSSLSRKEKKAIRQANEQRVVNHCQPSNMDSVSGSRASATGLQQSGNHLLCSTDETWGAASSIATVEAGGLTKSLQRSGRFRKPVKEAVISENTKDEEEIKEDTPIVVDEQHLEVKRNVELLRERFGKEHWLSQHGATQLQAVLGLPQNSPPLAEWLAKQVSADTQQTNQNLVSCTGVSKPISSQNLDSSEETAKKTDEPQVPCPEEQEKLFSEGNEEDGDAYMDQTVCSLSEEEDVDERKLFTVRRKDANSELLLLAVGVHQLQERDADSGCVRQRWDLSTLQSCEQLDGSGSVLRLEFDVLRRDRRSRTYQIESSEAPVLARLLGDILASRSLSEMNQVPYRCMKCSTLFSHEEDSRFASRGAAVVCPSCDSNIVCIMEEPPVPSSREKAAPNSISAIGAQVLLPPERSPSPSRSSLGSGASGSPAAALPSTSDCCLQVSAVVHQADAPSASPPRTSPPRILPVARALSVARSTASLESASAASARRGDSDIEVISNPSQSSIEVLDGESRTPGRKRSSEERQVVHVEVLHESSAKPASANAVAPFGLTESSSSGSFTDSVCTTYETQKCVGNGTVTEEHPAAQTRQSAVNTRPNKKFSDEPIEEETMEDGSLYGGEPVPSLQEMFEGLLEKVNKKLTRQAELKPLPSVMDNAVRYSYSDFRQVDHRLQLFILQELLEPDLEELLFVLRGDVMKTGSALPFPGLLVFSSAHIWVLHVTGFEGDNPETWLQKDVEWPLSSVSSVFPLPWSQGVGVNCGETAGHILVLLQDPQRTHSFLEVAGTFLPEGCGVVNEPANYHHQRVHDLVLSCSLSGDPESPVRLVSLLSSFKHQTEKECSIMHAVVVVTTSDMFVTEPNLSWLFPKASEHVGMKAMAVKQISDLVEVEVKDSSILLHFVDEANSQEETWTIEFQTAACVNALVAAIRSPWEQLFSVPLQVNEV